MKLKLTWVGQPKDVQTKYGTKQKCSVKAVEYADKYLDFWISASTKDWKVGDEVEVSEVTTREYNGKTYYSIVMPKVDNRPNFNGEISQILTKLGHMQFLIKEMHDHMSGKSKFGHTSDGKPVPFPSEQEINGMFDEI